MRLMVRHSLPPSPSLSHTHTAHPLRAQDLAALRMIGPGQYKSMGTGGLKNEEVRVWGTIQRVIRSPGRPFHHSNGH